MWWWATARRSSGGLSWSIRTRTLQRMRCLKAWTLHSHITYRDWKRFVFCYPDKKGYLVNIFLISPQKHVVDTRDHFLARFRDILAFFCKKSHQNSRSEKKNRTLNFSHFAPLSSYFHMRFILRLSDCSVWPVSELLWRQNSLHIRTQVTIH